MKKAFVKQKNDNYARCTVIGQLVFFNDDTAPTFTHPEAWVFWRVPRRTDAAAFRGKLIGVNPAEPTASDN